MRELFTSPFKLDQHSCGRTTCQGDIGHDGFYVHTQVNAPKAALHGIGNWPSEPRCFRHQSQRLMALCPNPVGRKHVLIGMTKEVVRF